MKAPVKKFLARRLEAALRGFTATRLGRIYFNQEVVRLLENNPNYHEKNWQITDRIYSACRRNLIGNPYWIPGSTRTLGVATKYFDHLKKYQNRTDLPFLDLGCGAVHPYGISTIFFLNGWQNCWALDISPCNERRACEAQADLIRDVLVHPERFAFLVNAETVLERVRRFDLDALDRGDLKAGLGSVPINYLVSDIAALPGLLGETRFGTICSHTVWEHFLQFDVALKTIREICAPGGLHYQYIDFVDHRAYTHPEDYDFWSFLTEPRKAPDPLCNKIRCSEMKEYISKGGFEILEWIPEESDYPKDLRGRLHSDWKDSTEDDLRAIRVSCIFQS